MQVIASAQQIKKPVDEARRAGRTIAFIPTMGALHEGHRSLMHLAARLSASETSPPDSPSPRSRRGGRGVRSEPAPFSVVSIFINPTQFNQAEDFEKYPHTLEADLKLCEKEEVDLVFTPSVAEIYPDGPITNIPVPEVGWPMEGEFRPGHFAGVCAVVARLFRIIQPDAAYFGEKDFQQIRVIEEMVKEQKIPVKIVRCPTVRDKNGLALSSRNARLSTVGYQQALAIPRGIRSITHPPTPSLTLREGEKRTRSFLAGLKIDYVTIADAETLEPIESINRPARIFIAAWVEGVRLIDNSPLMEPAGIRD